MFTNFDLTKALGVALLLVVALLLLAFFVGWLDRLIAGPDQAPRLPLDEVHDVEPTPGLDGEPEEVADQLPPMTLDERFRYLAADHALRYGSKLVIAEARADYRDEEPDEVDGDDAVPADEEEYPPAAVEPLASFAIWDRDEAKADPLTYNAMHAVPEVDSAAWRWDEPTGSWSVLDRKAQVPA